MLIEAGANCFDICGRNGDYMENNGLALGFQSQTSECEPCVLTVSGSIPRWLEGSLYRNGPAQFEVNSGRFRHWFDGLAKLHRFQFKENAVNYCSRFVRSNAFLNSKATGKISAKEFATNPEESLLSRLISLFSPKLTDNTNVNLTRLNGQMVAMTETTHVLRFDPETLTSMGEFEFSDRLSGHISTAHPQIEPQTGAQYNLLIKLGPSSSYTVFKIGATSSRRKQLARLPVKNPAYIHSFAATKKHLILFEYPLLLNVGGLLFSGKPYIENFNWTPQQGTRIHVINKENGEFWTTQTEAFFAFHQLNAFEEGPFLEVDIIAYENDRIVSSLYLENLRRGGDIPEPRPIRLRINLENRSVSKTHLSDCLIELPCINFSKFAGIRYRYAWSIKAEAGCFPSGLTKLDLLDGSHKDWAEDGCFCGEPVFVSNPELNDEDAGVILSVVLDSRQQSSFLLILDAKNMEELARIGVPQRIPFGFHGCFIEND